MTTEQLLKELEEISPEDKLFRVAKTLFTAMLHYSKETNGNVARLALDNCDAISGAWYPWSKGQREGSSSNG